MPKLVLRSAKDSIDLDSQLLLGQGTQALSGVTGLGLPPVSVQWSDGAGDGSKYRGRRVLGRDIDIPFNILAEGRSGLKAYLRQLALMLAEPCQLVFVEDDGTEWFTEVVRTGGGSYVYGKDTKGERELDSVLTLRSGDPYWSSSAVTTHTIGGPSGAQAGAFLANLLTLQVSGSQLFGQMTLENTGDVEAQPFWVVTGPGRDFVAALPDGQRFTWLGTITAGQQLIVDTRSGAVTVNGVNRYGDLAPAPKLWKIPPGTTVAEAALLDTADTSRITVQYRTRRWAVV